VDDPPLLGALGPVLREQGFTVIAPAYPGFDVEVEALRENPDVIADLTVPETVDYLAAVVEQVAAPPIIMGHSFGGTLTQLLLARGLGAAGVVIHSAPTEGVRVQSISQARSLFPALSHPSTRHQAVAFTREEFHYAFTNTLSEADSKAVWDRYAIAAPGPWVWEFGLFANFQPGYQATWVDFGADRAPLLFIAGGKDHIMPASVNRSNAKHYDAGPAFTDYHEFEDRDHWTCGAPGWEAVAGHALTWAKDNARAYATTDE
jgi:pimeloyl-ACP methyl ester carboxylesterase